MKKAFTILELVFVIVILGILAAIALPKMSSSKDEAEVSKSLNNLKTLINDISIYT
ncbi:prepilin-type N-terminal cleavage/methylation domain-containing protein, partial [Campylobacter coli]|nr:prepilin-type N-terminal cleavage/methylation domain-containing protein [Campylobacter coli]